MWRNGIDLELGLSASSGALRDGEDDFTAFGPDLTLSLGDLGLRSYFYSSTEDVRGAPLSELARGKKVLSIGANKGLVKKGMSLGVYLHKGKPRLVVNQRAAKVEGLDLEPAIKLISTVIK